METEELAGFGYTVVDHAGGAPPLLLLHKTGGDERELLPFAASIAPGSPVIAVRGPVSEDGKLRFFRRLSPGAFDEDDLRRRAQDLADFVEAVRGRHGLGRPIAVGLSNGANIAAAMMLLWPRTLDAAILLRPAPPFRHSPETELEGTPVLIVAGASDTTVPQADTVRLTSDLRERGATVDVQTIDAGHRMTDADTVVARLWLSTLPVPAKGHPAS
jgi:phospholipase/carboxylesterase